MINKSLRIYLFCVIQEQKSYWNQEKFLILICNLKRTLFNVYLKVDRDVHMNFIGQVCKQRNIFGSYEWRMNYFLYSLGLRMFYSLLWPCSILYHLIFPAGFWKSFFAVHLMKVLDHLSLNPNLHRNGFFLYLPSDLLAYLVLSGRFSRTRSG